jgi:hypothetical protein
LLDLRALSLSMTDFFRVKRFTNLPGLKRAALIIARWNSELRDVADARFHVGIETSESPATVVLGARAGPSFWACDF